MLLRVATTVIVLFWLGSIGWLCAVIWAPPGSRMSEVDPREVYDVFFAWNDQLDMTLLENGERRGQLTVAGASGTDAETGEFLNQLSVSGSLEEFRSTDSTPAANLFWKGVLAFDSEMELDSVDFSVRVPRQQLNAHFLLEGDPRRMLARATLGETEIFRYDGEVGGGAPLLPSALFPASSMLGSEGLDPANFEWESRASMGTFKFEGRTMRAYLLTLRPTGHGEELRIFLSEAGEPLRIETDLGFAAVSEILVPLDVYRRTDRPRQ